MSLSGSLNQSVESGQTGCIDECLLKMNTIMPLKCYIARLRVYTDHSLTIVRIAIAGNLGTQFLVHFRPKFGIWKVDENSECDPEN